MTTDVKSRLRSLLVRSLELDMTVDEIPDDGLVQSLGIDSVRSLEFLIWVENEFGIHIEDDDLSIELVDNLNTLTAYVASRLESAGPAPDDVRSGAGTAAPSSVGE